MAKKPEEEEIEVKPDIPQEPVVPPIISEAPPGKRELRPGVGLAYGSRFWSSAQFRLIDGKWRRDKLKNRFVPDVVAKAAGPKDEKEFNAWIKKLFL